MPEERLVLRARVHMIFVPSVRTPGYPLPVIGPTYSGNPEF